MISDLKLLPHYSTMYLLSRLHKRPSDIPNAPEESSFIYLSFVQLLMPFHCLYDCQKSVS